MYPLRELGIHRVECPVPFAAAGGPANVYLIEEADGGIALFDSGIGTPEGEKAVREGFARHGYRFGDVRRIYLSHGHIDHYGLARTISEESGAPVFIHEGDRLKVERPAAESSATRDAYFEYLALLGVSMEEINKVDRDHEYTLTMARPVERTQRIHGGDELRFKHFSAKVQHAPGHTPGLTCLYLEKYNLLFSDDHLLEKVSPNPLLEIGPEGPDQKFRSLVSYIHSLERMRQLNIGLVLPGHNDPFHDPNPIIERLTAFYERRQAKILDGLASGAKSPVELLPHVFPRHGKRELYLTLSEIVGNLEVLEEKGRVARLPANPVYRWELVQ